MALLKFDFTYSQFAASGATNGKRVRWELNLAHHKGKRTKYRPLRREGNQFIKEGEKKNKHWEAGG